jgi:DNA-binding NtrC family response regulator
LLMTGYADTSTYGDFLQTMHEVVLNKPVGIDALRAQVRRLLEHR